MDKYVNFFFLSNWFPILSSNPNFPVKIDGCSWTSLMISIDPKACQVIATLFSCKCKLTMCHILIAMEIIPIWRRYLRKGKPLTSYFLNITVLSFFILKRKTFLSFKERITKTVLGRYFHLNKNLHWTWNWICHPGAAYVIIIADLITTSMVVCHYNINRIELEVWACRHKWPSTVKSNWS